MREGSVPDPAGNIKEAQTSGQVPWQLRILSKSLKKQQKLAHLEGFIRGLPGTRRLLITHGDNNGALNYRLRETGGAWAWMEMEAHAIPGMESLLKEPVLKADPQRLPARDGAFDLVVSLDVQEHLEHPKAFMSEVVRITAPGGHVLVTTPNGDPGKPVSVLRRLIGMKREKYGHVVYGYNISQHTEMLEEAGLEPVDSGSYSGFFTELIELGINFAYTTILSGRKTGRGSGEIAPTTKEKLAAVEKQYRMYAMVYPLLLAVSKLDHLLPLGTGYAVSVLARRPEA